MTYASPYGRAAGLVARLEQWREQLGADKTLPWPGMGLVEDLAMAAKLLNLTEYAEWLRVHGTPEQQAFAEEILRDQETLQEVRDACAVAGYRAPDVVTSVRDLDKENRENERAAIRADDMRQVLVDTGALAAGDTDTDPAALLRALLS